MTSWSQMMTPGKGSFGDLEEKVDRGEITRREADEEMERRFERAAGHEERYGLYVTGYIGFQGASAEINAANG